MSNEIGKPLDTPASVMALFSTFAKVAEDHDLKASFTFEGKPADGPASYRVVAFVSCSCGATGVIHLPREALLNNTVGVQIDQFINAVNEFVQKHTLAFAETTGSRH